MIITMTGQATIRIGIYLPQTGSLLELGAIVEVFALTNRLLGAEKYQLFYVGRSQQTTWNAGGIALTYHYAIDDEFECDVLVVLADALPNSPLSESERFSLRDKVTRSGVQTIALHAAPYWLLASGIAMSVGVIHWSLSTSLPFREDNDPFGYQLFQHQHALTTCCGQTATLDCLLHYLTEAEGEGLAQSLADHLCYDRMRGEDEKQRLPSQLLGDDLQPRLTEAMALMENNLEEPLSTDEIADLVYISRRQLERLFKRYLDVLPAKYYLQLRLKHARKLLRTTHYSIVQVGLMCGFSSGPHFSSSYKAFYQITPREERAKQFCAK